MPRRSRLVKSEYFVESLGRGLTILSAFSNNKPLLSTAEISQLLQLNTTTVFRLLATMQTLGYVHQDELTKKYRPTPRILDLGFSALDGMALRQTALPHMRALSLKHDESVSLATLVDDKIVYLERVETTQLLNIKLAVGSRLPAYCTSMGKVLLAFQPLSRLDELLPKIDFQINGPNTITNSETLLRDLEIIRQRGYSINDQELAPGVRSTAAPIRLSNGEVFAAVNIAVPVVRVSLKDLKAIFASDLILTADAISRDWASICPTNGNLAQLAVTITPNTKSS